MACLVKHDDGVLPMRYTGLVPTRSQGVSAREKNPALCDLRYGRTVKASVR